MLPFPIRSPTLQPSHGPMNTPPCLDASEVTDLMFLLDIPIEERSSESIDPDVGGTEASDPQMGRESEQP